MGLDLNNRVILRIAVLCDIDLPLAEEVDKIIRAGGGEAIASANDVSNPEASEHLVQLVREHFGRVDILINNAAVCPCISIEGFPEITSTLIIET